MSDERLAGLEALCAAAHPGHWFYAGTTGLHGKGLHIVDVDCGPAGGIAYDVPDRSTAVFIATARTAFPELLAEVRRLRALLLATTPE